MFSDVKDGGNSSHPGITSRPVPLHSPSLHTVKVGLRHLRTHRDQREEETDFLSPGLTLLTRCSSFTGLRDSVRWFQSKDLGVVRNVLVFEDHTMQCL